MHERNARRVLRRAVMVEMMELRRHLSAAPDPTFDADGIVKYDDGFAADTTYQQIIAAAGTNQFVTVGEFSSGTFDYENLLIVRAFSASGSELGASTIALPTQPDAEVRVTDVVLDSGNNVYIGGYYEDPNLAGTKVGFITRTLAGGGLDLSFGGGDGILFTAPIATNDPSLQLVQTGGRLLATTVTEPVPFSGQRDVQVTAYDLSGQIDLSYGLAGTFTTALPNSAGVIDEVVVDGSGLLLIGTTLLSITDQAVLVGRVDAGGALDTNFGASGFTVSSPIGYAEATVSGVTRVSDGIVLSAMTMDFTSIVVKIDTTGELDAGFAGDGVLALADLYPTVLLSPTDTATRTLASDADGALYAAGFAFGDDTADFAIVSLNADGSPNTDFDIDGLYTIDEEDADLAFGVIRTASGAILASGTQISAAQESNGLLVQFAEPVVANTPPSVDPVVTAGSVDINVPTTFSSSFSDVDAADTFEVAWDFGDGNTLAYVGTLEGAVSASHTYTVANTYTVTVSVKDSAGNVTSNTGTIVVTTPPPPVPYAIVGGQLTLTGNATSDTIELVSSGSSYVLTVNGTPYAIGAALNSAVIYGGTGNDFIRVSTQITIPVSLIGGQGNDTLRGGSGNDVILGDEGNDLIVGRDGQDLMIGGTGADFLIGREDADILISGSTSLSSNLAALSAIQAEWTSNHNILVKLANVTGILPLPGRLNGNFFLTPNVTVFNDSSVDTLSGGDGADLYYISLFGLNADVIRDNQNTFAANIAALVFGD